MSKNRMMRLRIMTAVLIGGMVGLIWWQEGFDKLTSFTSGKLVSLFLVGIGLLVVAFYLKGGEVWSSISDDDEQDPVESQQPELVCVDLWVCGGRRLAYVYETVTDKRAVVRIPSHKFRKIPAYLFRFGDKVKVETISPDTEIQLEQGDVLFVPYLATKQEVDRIFDFTVQNYDKDNRNFVPELDDDNDTCWHIGPVVLAWHFATGVEDRIVPIEDGTAYGHYLIFRYMPVLNVEDYEAEYWESGDWKALAHPIKPDVLAVKIHGGGEVLKLRFELERYMDLSYFAGIVLQPRR